MSQEQKNKPAPEEERAQAPVEPKDKTATGQEIKKKADAIEAEIDKVIDGAKTDKEAIDEMVDEIDEVLEKDAQAFVEAFVQKGGE